MKWIDDDYDSDGERRKKKKSSFTLFINISKRQESIFSDHLQNSINDSNPRYGYVHVKCKIKGLFIKTEQI
jgi:hypothetical protein